MECTAAKRLACWTTHLSLISEQFTICFKIVLFYFPMLVKGGTTLSYCKMVLECVTACQSSSAKGLKGDFADS